MAKKNQTPNFVRFAYVRKFLKLFRTLILGFSVTSKPVTMLVSRRAKKCKDFDDFIALCFGFYGWFIRSSQVKEEITCLLQIIKKTKPKQLLEIGTADGGTLFLFAKVANSNATIISVDLPGGRFGGGYPQSIIPFYESFASKTQKVNLIRHDSHDRKTLDLIVKQLKNQKLDFIFIDGDHTYDGVKKDFNLYRPLVRTGGIIAFHDIVPGREDIVGGVPRFWREVKKNHTFIELVNDWNQGGYGIGVLFLNE
jgi:predicted O-methyltransferase YrrM